MNTTPPKLNRLEWVLSAGVPAFVVAAFAAWKQVPLGDTRLIPVMLCLGFGLALASPLVTVAMRKMGLQQEVLLQTALRVVISVGSSLLCAKYFLG